MTAEESNASQVMFIMKLLQQEEQHTLQILEAMGIIVTKISKRPVYKLLLTQAQADQIRNWGGVEAIISDKVIGTC